MIITSQPLPHSIAILHSMGTNNIFTCKQRILLGLCNTINTADTIYTPSISMANGATIEVSPVYITYTVEFGLLLALISLLLWNEMLPIWHRL